ncbi:MAG: glycine--tRNA ligase subunit beta [Candidatus Dojkabacteria bacterium]|nr:MAG: glycine--tRNA ligase subunit beta [Candidatus Dojkabacteria bacterium]
MTFQDIIATLNKFWADRGCIIAQPYGIEVGAGTSNPHTFFRVLGPEPYSVAYVEPSRRPTDGRYGQNPNRLQHYYQYQVILKPAPAFNQELYMDSLKALGISPKEHDIRFVEDNWESTPLGAWGLGWEVWLDGMEVSQYTYFQQVAGIPLEVPALEITYGLERLAMYIQNVDDYRDLKWNSKTSYGDIFEKHEYWQAVHNYEGASIQSLQELFMIYEKEAKNQLTAENYWAAYDYILKLSHLFNLLDSRGVISVSDRIAKFGMMAKLSKQAGLMYLDERKALDYPLKEKTAPISFAMPIEKVETKDTASQDVLIEVGLEEIPSEYLTEWAEQLTSQWITTYLQEKKLAFNHASIEITPRRLVVRIEDPVKHVKIEEKVFGPLWNICFTDNKPTQAGEGFAAKNNVKASSLKKELRNGKEHAVVIIKKEISLTETLQNLLNDMLATAPKAKWMKWEQGSTTFIRPVRWLVALQGKSILPLTIFDTVKANRLTYTPRYADQTEVHLSSASAYEEFAKKYKLTTSEQDRQKTIEKVKSEFKKLSPKIDSYITQNTFLTEHPALAAVELPSKYQKLPIELVTYILEKNQLYLMAFEGKKIFYTIVANHPTASKKIVEGNAKVAKARLEDGLFYMNQDSNVKLADLRAKLTNIAFHPKLGSFLSKVERIDAIATWILSYVEHNADVSSLVDEAGKLIKNEKASALGKEFPKLEGVIGYYYALRDGENSKVATVVRDYLSSPLSALLKKELAAEDFAALILRIADTADSYASLASVEGLPEGSHDPFEIRKKAYDLMFDLMYSGLQLPLVELFDYIQTLFTEKAVASSQDLFAFITQRFAQYIADEENIAQWIAKGTADSHSQVLSDKFALAKTLQKINAPAFEEEFKDSLKRIRNILQKENVSAKVTVKKELLETSSEKKLYSVLQKSVSLPDSKNPDYIAFFTELSKTLHTFFEETLVNAKEKKVKENRLALLRELYASVSAIFMLNY